MRGEGLRCWCVFGRGEGSEGERGEEEGRCGIGGGREES